MLKLRSVINTFIFTISIFLISSCHQHSPAWQELNNAENIINIYPDSALLQIKDIDTELLIGKEENARYALLKSIALDKNYIDLTTFDELRPAIDYYLQHGTPDEKLKTYYMQGIIYQNRNQSDSAMMAFLKGLDVRPLVKDSLALANLISARGVIQFSTNAYEDFTKTSLDAMRLYHALGSNDYELLSLAKALGGSILIENRQLADSLQNLAKNKADQPSPYSSNLKAAMLQYVVNYKEEEIRETLDKFSPTDSISTETRLDILLGYCKIKDENKATEFFNSIDTLQLGVNDMKYLAIKPDYLELKGDDKGALSAYRKYMQRKLKNLEEIMSQDLLFTQEHHDAELSSMESIHLRDRVIIIALASLCILTFTIGMLKYFLNKSKKRYEVSEKENLRLHQEKETQERIMTKLEDEKNIHLSKLKELEAERDSLKQLLKNREALSKQIKAPIRQRLEILNAFLASQISKNEQYSKTFDKECNNLIKDKDAFIESNKLAIAASNPRFIDYLEQRDLTDNEISYACLYVIGLNGKEIGNYIQLKRHYHISSDIRKKLGIETNSTNLGIYLRRLMKQLNQAE